MSTAASLPDCLRRDNLTSPYFPSLSRGGLAAVAALALVFVLTSLNRLNHTDLWGHLNFGRWAVEHGRLPAADPFAAAPASTPVLHAAWLAQVAGYGLHRWLGNEGLVLAHAILVTLTGGVLLLALVRRQTPLVGAAVGVLVLFVLELPVAGTIRPQLFGQLGVALFLLAVAELPRRIHPLVWLPLAAALWANLHGSVLVGLAILGIHAISTTWERVGPVWLARSARQRAADRVAAHAFSHAARREIVLVWLAVALAALGAMLNPHGPLLFLHTAAFGGHTALAAISEWQPLRPGSLTGVLMIASAIATTLLIKHSPRRWELREVLLLALFGLAVLPAIRMLAWWAVVWPWVCLPHAAAYWQKLAGPESEESEGADRPQAMRTVVAMGVAFAAVIIAPPTYSLLAGRGRGEGEVLVAETPLYVADEIERRGLEGTIAAPIDWADFVIWKTGGQLRPLVHSHVHLLAPQAWHDYQAIFRGDETWLPLLVRQHMNYVLVPRARCPQLAGLVLAADRAGQGVRVIYQDQRAVLAEVLKPTARE